MLKICTLFFSFFALFCNFLAAQNGRSDGQQLANYLGTGSNPRLQLVLSSNGPNWGSFTIDYQRVGNVPWSTDSSKNWSSWNVYDTANPPNYYGTITLKSNGQTVAWDKYVGGEGHYLNGVTLSYNEGISAYQLSAQSIYPPGGGGPFPNAPPATPAVYPGTNQRIILQVQGDEIVNNKGETILLKGLVRPSLEWNSSGQYLSTQDLSNIANWKSEGTTAKSNVIRLNLYQGYWFNSGPATEIGSYKQIINAIVYYSIQLGMTVILDLHWTESGHQSQMANKDSLTFWKQVAFDYKDFGTVLFELYNEPYDISKEVWLNGDNTYAGYQQLYDAVRETGAQNICIIGGLDFAYDLSFVNESFKVNGTNIVYCSHPYNQKGQSGYTGPGGTFQQNYSGILGKFPLIMTEFGVNEASYFPTRYQEIYSSILQFANANKIHYTGFAWWVQESNPEFPCLIKDWDGTALYGGVNVHDDIVQNPGTSFPKNAEEFASFDANLNPSRTPSLLDASKLEGDSFCWDFGDASNQCSLTPQVAHTYANPGTYVVSLTFLKNGIPQFTSRTVKIESTTSSRCILVCPPRDVEGKQVSTSGRKVTNVITWKGPKPAIFCENPVFYLVYRDQNLTDFVAEVRTPNHNGIYKVKDKNQQRGKATYAVVAVDQNGNQSLPVSVKVGNRRLFKH